LFYGAEFIFIISYKNYVVSSVTERIYEGYFRTNANKLIVSSNYVSLCFVFLKLDSWPHFTHRWSRLRTSIIHEWIWKI